MGNCIDLAKWYFGKRKKTKGETRVHYILRRYKNMVSKDITKYIGKHVTLVQLMDSWGNFNHAISVVGYWIFDWNYERALILIK